MLCNKHNAMDINCEIAHMHKSDAFALKLKLSHLSHAFLRMCIKQIKQ